MFRKFLFLRFISQLFFVNVNLFLSFARSLSFFFSFSLSFSLSLFLSLTHIHTHTQTHTRQLSLLRHDITILMYYFFVFVVSFIFLLFIYFFHTRINFNHTETNNAFHATCLPCRPSFMHMYCPDTSPAQCIHKYAHPTMHIYIIPITFQCVCVFTSCLKSMCAYLSLYFLVHIFTKC